LQAKLLRPIVIRFAATAKKIITPEKGKIAQYLGWQNNRRTGDIAGFEIDSEHGNYQQ
jgi:hypothetical protein